MAISQMVSARYSIMKWFHTLAAKTVNFRANRMQSNLFELLRCSRKSKNLVCRTCQASLVCVAFRYTSTNPFTHSRCWKRLVQPFHFLLYECTIGVAQCLCRQRRNARPAFWAIGQAVFRFVQYLESLAAHSLRSVQSAAETIQFLFCTSAKGIFQSVWSWYCGFGSPFGGDYISHCHDTLLASYHWW